MTKTGSSGVGCLSVLVLAGTGYAGVNKPTLLFEPGVNALSIRCDLDSSGTLYCLIRANFFGLVDEGNRTLIPAKSTDNGATWSSACQGIDYTKFAKTGSEYDYYLLRTNVKPQTLLYIAYNDPFNGGPENSYAIFKSTDQAGSWKKSVETSGHRMHAVAIKPDNPEFIIAGGHGEVIISQDGGRSWEATLMEHSPTHIRFSPVNYSKIYLKYGYGIAFRLMQSIDLGQTWECINGNGNFGCVGTWIEPHPTDENCLYMATDSYGYEYQLRRTLDGGQTWEDFGPRLDINDNAVNMFVNPLNPDNILCRMQTRDSVYSTIDGGNTWLLVLDDRINAVYFEKSNIAFSPFHPNRVYMAANGFDISDDFGITWKPLSMLPYQSNFSNLSFIHPADRNTIIVSIPKVGFFKTTDFGNAWASANDGLVSRAGGYIQADVSNPNRLYFSQFTRCVNLEIEYSLFQSSDMGDSWTKIELQKKIRHVFTSIHIHDLIYAVEVVDDKCYSSGSYRILQESVVRSSDGGNNWETMTIPELKIVHDIKESPVDPVVIFVLGQSQDSEDAAVIFKSMDNGLTWSVFDESTGFAVSGRHLDIHPNNPNLILAGGPLLSLSTDGGQSWNPIYDRTSSEHNIRLFDPRDDKTIYAAGYRSVDQGKTWSEVKVFEPIFFDPPDRMLIDNTPAWMIVSDQVPVVALAGYVDDRPAGSEKGRLTFCVYAYDPDPEDYPTSIGIYYQGEFTGHKLYDVELGSYEQGDGLFTRELSYNVPDAWEPVKFEFRARDRFSNLSDPWPMLKSE